MAKEAPITFANSRSAIAIFLKLKHSTSKACPESGRRDESKRQAKEAAIREVHRDYLEQAEDYLRRARLTRQHLENGCGVPAVLLAGLDAYPTPSGSAKARRACRWSQFR